MPLDLVTYRLYNQRLSHNKLDHPADVVTWLGAVHAQDFLGAKWALGLRTNGLSETDIDRAFADGSILRTHLLRPTWHFVTPADIRWILALTAPRVRAALAYMDRQLELDKTIFEKSNAVLTKTLRDGKQLSRVELGSALQKSGINTDELRLGHLMIHAELDGVICSGARRDKQYTYALLEERVPPASALEHEEALAELSKRYFTSHGPATLQDFVWWSGLSAADAKHGLEMIKSQLEHEDLDHETYWFTGLGKNEGADTKAYLLPNYDEFTVGYTDRSAIFDAAHSGKLDSRGSVLAQHSIVLEGQIVGTWKRTLKKDSVTVDATLFTALKKSQQPAITEAAEGYGIFLGLPVMLKFREPE